jgi:hypothetical protein
VTPLPHRELSDHHLLRHVLADAGRCVGLPVDEKRAALSGLDHRHGRDASLLVEEKALQLLRRAHPVDHLVGHVLLAEQPVRP